jgi:methionyl-tRNA formyltransferase
MKLMLMADSHVGLEILRWLLTEYPRDLVLVVVTSESEICNLVRNAKIPLLFYQSSEQVLKYANDENIELDLGIMAWWPKIIKQPLIALPRFGFINTHPSLLPHNRGKHYNFWALVEQAPFGATLHFVEEGIDCGDVIAQSRIPYGWEDNGGTLYVKAQSSILALFRETYPYMRALNIPRSKQNFDIGSFHTSREMGIASQIDLERQYRARDLLNLLRGRTFPGHPACWFSDEDEEYEIRIEINKRKQSSDQV